MLRWLKLTVPMALAALAAVVLAVAAGLFGRARTGYAQPRAEPGHESPHADDAVVAEEEAYRCRQPAIEIPKSEGCARGRGYPHCRWQLPSKGRAGPGNLYTVWRNTVPDHRWARPGLVSLVVTAAAEYARRWPGERLTIGDLDAPGPRHATHDRGVDVDLYLPNAMMTRNEGGGRYVNNYERRTPEEIHALRGRVMDLGRILASCANGQIRIYYNDPEIVGPFRQWFDARGLRSEVGPPMRTHNALHEFHFHLTIPETFAPLETAEP